MIGFPSMNLLSKSLPRELDWEEKDTFTIPVWRWHQHRNASKTEPVFLWSVSDSPIYEAFGLYREEGA